MNKRKHTGAKSVKFYDIFKTLRRSEQQSDTHNKNVLTGAAAHVQSLMGPPVICRRFNDRFHRINQPSAKTGEVKAEKDLTPKFFVKGIFLSKSVKNKQN